MSDAVNDGMVGIDLALTWHLCFNHFPPISDVFVPTAQRAIDLANEGQWEEMITMPNGVTLPAGMIVEQLHLQPFLDDDEDDVTDDTMCHSGEDES